MVSFWTSNSPHFIVCIFNPYFIFFITLSLNAVLLGILKVSHAKKKKKVSHASEPFNKFTEYSFSYYIFHS